MNKSTFGMALVIAMAVFTVPATAYNVMYLVPQDSSADPDGNVTVWLMLNTSHNDLGGFGANIAFDTSVVNVTLVEEGTTPVWDQWGWVNWGDHVCISGLEFGGTGPGELQLGKMTLECVNPGISPLNFQNLFAPEDPTSCSDIYGEVYTDFTAINGTFTCAGPPTTFTKSLATGWNLISLPLTPSDNSTSAVLSGVSDVVYRYNATSDQFECPDTMDPGIGYFVHVTTPGTWEYEGTPEFSTSTELKAGLNMIGVPNCTISVGAAMESTDYRYVARWNAADQEFEVYNPSAPAAFHHFDMMEAGEGYFVSAKSDYTLDITCPI